MKYISDKYPLIGYDFENDENYQECYELAEQFVAIILREKKSYAEACKVFDIAKNGLETIKFKN